MLEGSRTSRLGRACGTCRYLSSPGRYGPICTSCLGAGSQPGQRGEKDDQRASAPKLSGWVRAATPEAGWGAFRKAAHGAGRLKALPTGLHFKREIHFKPS